MHEGSIWGGGGSERCFLLPPHPPQLSFYVSSSCPNGLNCHQLSMQGGEGGGRGAGREVGELGLTGREGGGGGCEMGGGGKFPACPEAETEKILEGKQWNHRNGGGNGSTAGIHWEHWRGGPSAILGALEKHQDYVGGGDLIPRLPRSPAPPPPLSEGLQAPNVRNRKCRGLRCHGDTAFSAPPPRPPAVLTHPESPGSSLTSSGRRSQSRAAGEKARRPGLTPHSTPPPTHTRPRLLPRWRRGRSLQVGPLW